MGQKTLRRVPLDFNWPIGKIWEGFLDPHHRECPRCSRGRSPAGEILHRLTELLLLAGGDAVRGGQHPWLRDLGMPQVSPDMIELTSGLAGRSPKRSGHDAGDVWEAFRKIANTAGLPKNWGECPLCKGSVQYPATKEASDNWQATDPPAGEGWQLWETMSDGSPVSPVFKTAEELAAWCEVHANTVADFRATKEQWLMMFLTEDGVDRATTLCMQVPGVV